MSGARRRGRLFFSAIFALSATFAETTVGQQNVNEGRKGVKRGGHAAIGDWHASCNNNIQF